MEGRSALGLAAGLVVAAGELVEVGPVKEKRERVSRGRAPGGAEALDASVRDFAGIGGRADDDVDLTCDGTRGAEGKRAVRVRGVVAG